MKYSVKRHAVVQPLDKAYRLIPLTQGQNAIVDVEDFVWVSRYNWFAHWSPCTKSFYALRGTPNGLENMHRIIAGCKADEDCDHRNNNTLDNRRGNLRKCSQAQNARNKRTYKNSSTSLKGVTYRARTGKWEARIQVNGRRIHIGEYASPVQAAKAYDSAAIFYHADFAHPNFPHAPANTKTKEIV